MTDLKRFKICIFYKKIILKKTQVEIPVIDYLTETNLVKQNWIKLYISLNFFIDKKAEQEWA